MQQGFQYDSTMHNSHPLKSTDFYYKSIMNSLKIHMKSINNSLCTHSSENSPPNNHKLMVWMISFPLSLIWVEMHNGLGPCFLVVIKESLEFIKTELHFKSIKVEVHHKKNVETHLKRINICHNPIIGFVTKCEGKCPWGRECV